MGKGFLLTLARKPVWLLGSGAQILGFVAQAIALGVGRMVVVQPLLVASIVFALPLSWAIEHRRIRREELVGAALVTAGLGGLLAFSKPAEGTDDASLGAWALVGGATVGLAAVLFLVAPGTPAGPPRGAPGDSSRRHSLRAGGRVDESDHLAPRREASKPSSPTGTSMRSCW